jgi:hypothetical protein
METDYVPSRLIDDFASLAGMQIYQAKRAL